MTLHRHSASAGVQWALVVSILIHGLVLWAWRVLPGPGAEVASSAALQVVVAVPAAAAPAAEPTSEPQPRPQPEASQRLHPPQSLPVQALRPEARPEPASAPAPAAPSAPANGPASVISMTPATATPVAAPEPVPPRPGPDADGLRQYRAALGVQAGRFKRYPPRARESGWEGRVTLRVVVAQAGAPVSLSLARSSGHELLDEAALEMMRLAAARTPLPESLRGQPLAFDLPVDYNLRDE